MSIESTLTNDLASLNISVFEQGSWTGGDLPDTFITYQVVMSTDKKHYNNRPTLCEWQLQINVYSSDANILESTRANVETTLLDKGYTRDGKGFSGDFDERTGHYAWYYNFYKLEREE